MTRMGVIVGEGLYTLAGDLLQAFLPLLYVGEGLEEAGGDECGIDLLAGLSLAGKGKGQQHLNQQPEAAAPQPNGACVVDSGDAGFFTHTYMHTDVRPYPPQPLVDSSRSRLAREEQVRLQRARDGLLQDCPLPRAGGRRGRRGLRQVRSTLPSPS